MGKIDIAIAILLGFGKWLLRGRIGMGLIPFTITKNSVVLLGGGEAVLLMKAGGVNVPMTLGLYEANFMASLLADGAKDEPSASNLLKRLLVAFEAPLAKIEITGISETRFISSIFFQKRDEEISLEAFPTEAIILALSLGAPMFIDEQVIIDATEPENIQRFLSDLEEVAPHTLES